MYPIYYSCIHTSIYPCIERVRARKLKVSVPFDECFTNELLWNIC